MGGIMEELEFSRELVKILDKYILQKTLRKAAAQGFTVQGFNKNVWLAPAMVVSSALERRKRGGKYQYKIFLECLAGLEGDNMESNLARKWLKNGEEREEAEKQLLEIKADKRIEGERKVARLKEVVSNDTEEKEGHSADVVSQQQQREHIRKLKDTIQEYKILADDYKKEIRYLRKEKSKLEKECEEGRRQIGNLLERIEGQQKQINKYHQELKTKEEEINYYKRIFEKMPGIICFAKRKVDNEMFPFHKIEQVSEWRNEFLDEVDWNKYQEVWIVESDFSYPEVLKIKKMAKGKIVCARNLKSLIGKAGGHIGESIQN